MKPTDWISNSLDKLSSDVQEIKIVQAENTQILKEHKRRSEANEARLGVVEELAEKFQLQLERHFGFLRGATWILSGFAALIMIVCGIISVLIQLK